VFDLWAKFCMIYPLECYIEIVSKWGSFKNFVFKPIPLDMQEMYKRNTERTRKFFFFNDISRWNLSLNRDTESKGNSSSSIFKTENSNIQDY
jgi:hypothetical protein